MSKITLSTITNIFANPASATTAINANFAALQSALDTFVSRDGKTPNQLTSDFDLNSNNLLNAGTGNFTNLILNGDIIAPVSALGSLTLPYASQAEAQIGTENTHVMTPLRTVQSIGAVLNPATSVTGTVDCTVRSGVITCVFSVPI